MLKPGQHVVLINDRFDGFLARVRPQLPRLGRVYTIRGIFEVPGEPVQCYLEELINPSIQSGRGPMEPAFMLSRFRPLVPIKVEDFTAGLTPVDQLKLLKEYEGTAP